MPGLQHADILVHDQAGHPAHAKLFVCPCGGQTWHVYRLGAGGHIHMQCETCQVTYCDGACSRPPKKVRGRKDEG